MYSMNTITETILLQLPYCTGTGTCMYQYTTGTVDRCYLVSDCRSLSTVGSDTTVL